MGQNTGQTVLIGVGVVVGAVVGYFTGGVGWALAGSILQGAAYGYGAGAIAGSLLFPTEQSAVRGPRIEGRIAQTSIYGRRIPMTFGRDRIGGNIIWWSGFKFHEEGGEGGKGFGGGGGGTSSTFYTVDLDIVLNESGIIGIRQIWAGGKLIYKIDGNATVEEILASNQQSDAFVFYDGNDEQTPDPTEQAWLSAYWGIDQVPAYRGISRVILKDFNVTEHSANVIPPFTFEVIRSGNATEGLTVKINQSFGPEDQDIWNAEEFLGSAPGVYPRYANGVFHLANGVYDHYFDAEMSWLGRQKTRDEVEDGAFQPGAANVLGYLGPYLVQDFVSAEIVLNDGTVGTVPCLVAWASSAPFDPYRVIVPSWSNRNNLKIDTFKGAAALTNDGQKLYVWFITWNEPAHSTVTFHLRIYGRDLDYEEHEVSGETWGGFLGPPPADVFIPHMNGVWGSGGAIWNETSATAIDSDDPSLVWVVAGNIVYLYQFDESWNLIKKPGYQVGVIGLFANLVTIYSQDGLLFLWVRGANGVEQFVVISRWPSLDDGDLLLKDVIYELCERADIPRQDVDAEELTDVVRGFTLSETGSYRAAFEQLAATFFFDAFESDWQIKFRHFAQVPVATIPEDDLGAMNYGGRDIPERMNIERGAELELPREIAFSYIAGDVRTTQGGKVLLPRYEVATARASRMTTSSIEARAISSAVVLHEAEGRAVADQQMYLTWLTRHRKTIRVGPKWIALEPGDVVRVDLYPWRHYLRITEARFDRGVITLAGVDAAAPRPLPAKDDPDYAWKLPPDPDLWPIDPDPIVDPDPIPPPDDGPILEGPTRIELLNLPALRDVDGAQPNYYAAANGFYDNWRGAVLHRSQDGGASYEQLRLLSAKGVIGFTRSLLGAPASPHLWDNRSLEVEIFQGALFAASEADLYAGKNAAAVGADGRWEIIQFRQVSQLDDRRWRIAELLRGRKGTEHAMANHAVGDFFILLSESSLARLPDEAADIGQPYLFKAVTLGQNLADAIPKSFSDSAQNLVCYAPVHVHAVWMFTGDLYIEWTRRNRIIHEWLNSSEVPMSEAAELYEIDILDADGAVLRTLASDSPFAQYSAMDYAIDYPDGGDVRVQVFQVSEILGRGQGSEIAVAYNAPLPFPGAPSITSITTDTGQSATDGITSDQTVLLSGTAEPNADVVVRDNGVVVGQTVSDETGEWQLDLTDILLSEGQHSFTATAVRTGGVQISTTSSPKSVTIDITPPVFGSARINGNTLTIEFPNANLDSANPPAASRFTPRFGGSPVTVNSLNVNAAEDEVVLTLASAATSSTVVTLDYADPSSGDDAAALQDKAGNDAASFSGQAVTNLTPDPIENPPDPTVNPLTTSDDTPTVTGTWTNTPGDTLVFRLNGVIYSVGSGLTINANNWSAQVTAPLANGTYTARAEVSRSGGGTSSASAAIVIDKPLPVGGKKWHPGHYIASFVAHTAREVTVIAGEPKFLGVHQQYWWGKIERSRGNYDFSAIDADLNYMKSIGKRLAIMPMERSFNTSSTLRSSVVPQYMLSAEFGGGVVTVDRILARLWDPAVMERYILLLEALAKRYDNDAAIEWCNIPESAVPINDVRAVDPSYSNANHQTQILRLHTRMAAAWRKTVFDHFINFGSASEISNYTNSCYQKGFGVGGPDVNPPPSTRPTVTPGSQYVKDHGLHGKLPIIHSVQPPDYYLGGSVHLPPEHLAWAKNTLKVSHLSWSMSGRDGAINKYKNWWPEIRAAVNATDGTLNNGCPQNVGVCVTG